MSIPLTTMLQASYAHGVHERDCAPSSDPWVRGIFALFFTPGKSAKNPLICLVRQIGRNPCTMKSVRKILKTST